MVDLVFSRDDCMVNPAVFANANGTLSKARVGIQNGISLNGRMPTQSDRNRITITHVPTGISVTEDRFIMHRNKELAFRELERLVKIRIEEIKAAIAANENNG